MSEIVTDEIVEKAAQAIFALRQEREPLVDWGEQFDSAKAGYLRSARAALEAVAAEMIAGETELCAKICDAYAIKWGGKISRESTDEGRASIESAASAGTELGALIRARKG